MHLTLKNLHVTTPTGKTLFTDAEYMFNGPGLFFITGGNGVGKSTLMRIMSGQTPRDLTMSGSITIENKTYELRDSRSVIGIQDHVTSVDQKVIEMLAPSLSVAENIAAAGLRTYPGLSLYSDNIPVPYGIDPAIPVEKLSGGQQQLLALFLMMQKKPSIILLDEPTAALDHDNARKAMEMIRKHAQDKLIICVCHDQQLMQEIPHKVNFRLGF